MELTVRRLQLQNGRVPFDEWFASLENRRTQIVVTARLTRLRAGNLGELAGKAPLRRQNLSKALSAKGNPTLGTLGEILGHLGLRLSVSTV